MGGVTPYCFGCLDLNIRIVSMSLSFIYCTGVTYSGMVGSSEIACEVMGGKQD